ncbi:hypothetical protein KAU11_02045 [Candidatus Babeliales bacterium]|nr:hypothetical protein [Candidatus Babeliales bacterium]
MDEFGKDVKSEISKLGWFASLWPFKGHEASKALYLSLIFSSLIFAYSIIKPLKDTVFVSFVGATYIPWAKLLMIISLPIFMYFYLAVGNKHKRTQALVVFSLVYGIGCLMFIGFMMHPVFGVRCTMSGPFRLLGWLFYAFLDFYSIAVVATFWALVNSISTPEEAKGYYGIMVAASRTAGAVSSGIGALLLRSGLQDIVTVPILIGMCAAGLFACVFFVLRMFEKVPTDYLKGYSDRHEHHQKKKKLSFWGGLQSLVTQPYVFYMFWLLCSFELVSTLMNYRMQCLIAQATTTISGVGSFMFLYTFSFQVVGAFVALFGTTAILKHLGVRVGLFVTPVIVLSLAVGLIAMHNLAVITTLMLTLRILDYSVDVPIRQILFIPTTHDIQYGVKGWIASVGKTVSKTTGSLFNGIATVVSGNAFLMAVTYAPLVLGGFWLLTANAVGKRYQKAVENEQVIGEDDFSE